MSRSVAAAVLILAAACGPAEPSSDAAAQINSIADRYVAEWVQAFPHDASVTGVASAPYDRLMDVSPAAYAHWHGIEDSLLVALEAVDTSTLPDTSAAWVTRGFLDTVLRNAIDWRVCRMELWNVSPTWTGPLSVLASLAEIQPVATPEQREAAAQRYADTPRYFAQEIANLREGARLGFTMPRHNVEAVIRMADALLAAPVAESPFVVMAKADVPEFRSRMEAVELDAIRPAITAYRDYLRDEYLPLARTAIGVSANPKGDACYAAAVKYHATVDMSAQEVHQVGLDQMAIIRAEMEAIAQRLFGTTDVASALGRLRNEPPYQMGSREALLQTARDAVARAKAAVPQWFGLLPKSDVIVQPVPAFSEASAPGAFYTNPAEDGSRPGTYSLNLRGAETTPRAGVEATAFHEALPGHHLQSALALERTSLHPVSRYIFLSGFGEGWALYTERLADEMGLYSGDVDRMGLLSNEALRAARLVVDAGMHGLGWTREQAIQYMLDNTAESRQSVTAEVDRYIAVPAQATAYMLGNLEIRRLRALAEAAQGSGFDIKAFHDRVLEDGSVPLSMLRAKIERWIAN
ncbi:MAG: DUF885 domain-containing protein [Gemmatimonadota bacterium]|nr:DUF885 domain-containing protein [Gemmatimonadota bacterium]